MESGGHKPQDNPAISLEGAYYAKALERYALLTPVVHAFSHALLSRDHDCPERFNWSIELPPALPTRKLGWPSFGAQKNINPSARLAPAHNTNNWFGRTTKSPSDEDVRSLFAVPPRTTKVTLR